MDGDLRKYMFLKLLSDQGPWIVAVPVGALGLHRAREIFPIALPLAIVTAYFVHLAVKVPLDGLRRAIGQRAIIPREPSPA